MTDAAGCPIAALEYPPNLQRP